MTNLLFQQVIDTFETLEVVVHLCRCRTPNEPAAAIGACLALPPRSIASALWALSRAGIIRTRGQDGAGWWFDEASVWAESVKIIADWYEHDPNEVLRVMKFVALETVRDAHPFGRARIIRVHRGGKPN